MRNKSFNWGIKIHKLCRIFIRANYTFILNKLFIKKIIKPQKDIFLKNETIFNLLKQH